MSQSLDNSLVSSRWNMRNPFDFIILPIAAHFGDKAKEVERFLKFVVVGVFGALVDFGTVFLLQATLFPPTDPSGNRLVMNVTLATSIAFVAAVANNYLWNRFWTYPDARGRSARRQLALFAFVSFVGWLGRTLWINAAYHPVGITMMPILLPFIHIFRPGYLPTNSGDDKLGTMIAQLIGVIVVMFWNYFVNRYWTYNDANETDSPART
jgi:putative flippase GtrA